ncbi:hypothetical protein V6R21_29195 [Limibacter armeniacum]|uniref:hypothetical protein n=1 Tax=Limibacter armeniacum TaxID=466084 RepID=UPI002FE54EF9
MHIRIHCLLKNCSVALMLVITLLVDLQAFASVISDPLEKPQLWQKLKEAPTDSLLWSSYIGKPWVAMTIQEKEKVEEWKSQLTEELISNSKEVYAGETKAKAVDDSPEAWEGMPSQEQITASEQIQIGKELKEHFKAIESAMLSEPDYIAELKRNLTVNFVILDATYREEFEAYGVNYRGYYEVYPEGNYPQEKWIAEKSSQLRLYKKSEFEKMKAEMLRTAN